MTDSGTENTVRIGCASAFWGDTSGAAAQLVASQQIDYLVFDYLAEITMSIMAGQRLRDPQSGYARDFVPTIARLLRPIKAQGIRVVSNAGGVNPLACRDALAAAAAEAGIEVSIAVVLGDDLKPRQKDFANLTETDSGETLPGMLVSMNAYLGATPIRDALAAGADIVITGRCVDSAVVIGPLMHEFGWAENAYDKLAAAAVAGHIIECGAQCTGGNFTDWETVPGYENMGFPIVEVQASGDFTVTKPADTGGLISPHTVGEQMLYEIGDPRCYKLPDVTVDFTQVRLEQVGDNRVAVSGARGLPPTDTYKVSATYPAGFRNTAIFMIGGIDAAAKGRRVAEALLSKISALFTTMKLGDFTGTDIEIIGSESSYGPHARPGAQATREVLVKISVKHDNIKALKLFGAEIAQAATGMAPGITGFFGGRAKPMPIIKLFSTLVAKADVPVSIQLAGEPQAVSVPSAGGFSPDLLPAPYQGETAGCVDPAATLAVAPLVRLAVARSGDKGDHANIGVMARKPEYLPYLRAALTPEAVAEWFAHVLEGEVQRWELPGSNSFNFLLTHALGGGGVASLRADPQGKCFAQMLLEFPVPVSLSLAGTASD